MSARLIALLQIGVGMLAVANLIISAQGADSDRDHSTDATPLAADYATRSGKPWPKEDRFVKANARGPPQFRGYECPLGLVEKAAYIDCLDLGADIADAAGDTKQAASWREMANVAWAAAEAKWWNAKIGCYAQRCKHAEPDVVGFLLRTEEEDASKLYNDLQD